MLNDSKVKELKKFAIKIRMEAMKAIGHLGVGHVGGTLSVADVLAVLYGEVMKIDPKNPRWRERDWLVMSKGHAGPALYAALALKGFFPMENLLTLNRPGTTLPSHCDRNKTPGVDMTTGSLGQGASTAAGVALGNRMSKIDSYTYLILGDGECDEGQVWEMALFAAHRKLSNLIAFVDYNKQQLDGYTKDICELGDLGKKFEEFGWFTQSIDGHDVVAIYEAISKAKAQKEKPSMIILNTIKGKGVKAYEGSLKNHNCNVSKEELESILAEFEDQLKALEEC